MNQECRHTDNSSRTPSNIWKDTECIFVAGHFSFRRYFQMNSINKNSHGESLLEHIFVHCSRFMLFGFMKRNPRKIDFILSGVEEAKFLSALPRVRTGWSGLPGCRAPDQVGPKSGLPLFTNAHFLNIFFKFLAPTMRIPLFKCVWHFSYFGRDVIQADSPEKSKESKEIDYSG